MKRADGQDKFISLRKKYPEFVYESFNISEENNSVKVSFHFSISDDIKFNPTIVIPKKRFDFKIDINDKKLNNIIFNLGLIELISYWKCTCSPTVIIKPGFLDDEQIEWWKKLYYNGLGEFFYVNSIDTNIDDFLHIKIESSNKFRSERFHTFEENIIPIGGGKDSLVTLELLSQFKEKNTCLIVNPKGPITDGVLAGGYSKESIFDINRTIDKRLLELNREGYLNGHTPFSSLLGFVTVFSAVLLGKKYIVLSNESSANESTVGGSNISHQYSKSFEFERDFNSYIHKYITEDIYYFSLLRPFSEMKIAQLLSRHKKYFNIFKSCNVGSKEEDWHWCGKCPKCLFVYIILAPFVERKELIGIFGKDLLDNRELQPIFDELVGKERVKPFECVGTRDEVNAALSNLLNKYNSDENPYLLQYYKNNLSYLVKPENEIDRFLKFFDEDNLIPKSFKSLVKEL